MSILPLEYYQNDDVLFLSQDLLGKFLLTKIGLHVTGGMIIETEAYRGPEDRASHAYNDRYTNRNAVMYKTGGISYVYLVYGIHYLFNIVTNKEDVAHAILVRAIYPSIGIEEILKRRNKSKVDRTVAGGPGTLTQALGITLKHNGLPLIGPSIWLEDRGVVVPKDDIVASPRIGIDYAGEHAGLPWRFRLKPYLHMTQK
jgi:DNA-3-methyladenine glycosylase